LNIGETISRQTRAFRTARGLTLQELADRTGTSKSYIWEIEKRGTANPTIEMTVALARALGVSFDELTGISTSQPALHAEAMRIACEVDALLRQRATPEAS
jgi:transcriptional regulator with XRE-family HTH domain